MTMTTTTTTTTTTSRPVTELLRPEALEAHREPLVFPKADPLRKSRAPFAFAALVAAAAAVVVVSLVVRVDQSAVGYGRVDSTGRHVVVVLPVGALPSLRTGLEVDFESGGRSFRGRLLDGSRPLDAAAAARAIDRSPVSADGASAIARVELTSDNASEVDLDGMTGSVTVHLGRQRLWDLVAPARLFPGAENG